MRAKPMDAGGNDRTERAFYQAYLIRMWRESRQGAWRASAQSVADGQVTRFGTLRALFAFLERQADQDVANNVSPTVDEDNQDMS